VTYITKTRLGEFLQERRKTRKDEKTREREGERRGKGK
jgi:hypothetical protein